MDLSRCAKLSNIAAQIASGLAAAHAAGIVHRDLKPDNVIVTPEGTAKILDFGVARLESRSAPANNATMTIAAHTEAGSVVGTAAYMSPEQARAQNIDYRSDQFSLGLILYEMLAGKQAFERPSAVQTMSAIVEDDPPAIDRALPSQLRWILQRCLAKEPEERYESTRDLARELSQLRDHFSEFTSTTGQLPAATASPGRRTKRGWPIAAAALAAALLTWIGAQLLRDPHRVDLSHYRLTPFATAFAAQSWPAWSPDGRSIAFFGSSTSAPTQVYVQAVDAPTAVAITGAGVTVHSWYRPFWSPDSRTVYFRCDTGGQEGFCRAPAGGGETVVVQRGVLSATLSPDGKTLAMLVPDASFYLRLMTASPPEAKPILYEPQPLPAVHHYNNPTLAFSPDGKQILIAIAFQNIGETVRIAPWPQGKTRAIFPGGFPFSFTPQVTWMPDSRRIVFSDSTAKTNSEIFMADVLSGRYWPVFVQDRGASTPSVSPDGSRIAYQSGLSQADVIAVPLGDGPVRTLLGSFRTEQMADASPVSAQLVYVTDRRGPQEVWLSSLAEGWDRPVFTPQDFQMNGSAAEVFLAPAFSPDGKRIAVEAVSAKENHIYTAFVSGGTPVRATSGERGFEGAPAWSPDGKWISFEYIAHSSLQLAKVRPGSGELPVDLGAIASNPDPAWSPTGEWIAACNDQDAPTLFSPDGKPPRALPGKDCGPFAWSRDGKTLYQVRFAPALFAIDIAAGREQKLRDLGDLEPYAGLNPGLRASLTSDGKSIVYTVDRLRQEIWILDGIQPPRAWYESLLGR